MGKKIVYSPIDAVVVAVAVWIAWHCTALVLDTWVGNATLCPACYKIQLHILNIAIDELSIFISQLL